MPVPGVPPEHLGGHGVTLQEHASAVDDEIPMMMSEDHSPGEAEPPEGSIFGSLPRERPGTRSPRRDRGTAAARGGGDTGSPPREPPSLEHDAGATGGSQIRGIEDLAWAGVAVAAEAATLGLRLAGRAIDAVRGPTERP
jgi:hypothetical protein